MVTNPAGSPAGTFPVIAYTTGGAGSNDHTLDIGMIMAPTAADASISGRVITAGGTGISRAQVTVVDAATSQAKVGMTNLFGYFNVGGLEVGKLYIISVSHPTYQFTQNTQSFVLNDNVSGLVFVASGSTGKGGIGTVEHAARLNASKSGPQRRTKAVINAFGRVMRIRSLTKPPAYPIRSRDWAAA